MKIAWSYSVYYLTLHKFQKKKCKMPINILRNR